jgi:hypothetical protein
MAKEPPGGRVFVPLKIQCTASFSDRGTLTIREVFVVTTIAILATSQVAVVWLPVIETVANTCGSFRILGGSLKFLDRPPRQTQTAWN